MHGSLATIYRAPRYNPQPRSWMTAIARGVMGEGWGVSGWRVERSRSRRLLPPRKAWACMPRWLILPFGRAKVFSKSNTTTIPRHHRLYHSPPSPRFQCCVGPSVSCYGLRGKRPASQIPGGPSRTTLKLGGEGGCTQISGYPLIWVFISRTPEGCLLRFRAPVTQATPWTHNPG